jgi:hypothetical protein
MTSSSMLTKGVDPRRRAYILVTVAACAVAASVLAQDMTAYFCVTIPALAPLFVWLWTGAPGIPVLPAISGVYLIYYAFPLFRADIEAYGPQALVTAGATVGSFLVAASVGSLPFLLRAQRRARVSAQSFASTDQIVAVVFIGLVGGIVYNLALMTGNLTWLGASASVLRAVASTLTSVACYLLGSARASRLLVGQRWMLALVSLVGVIILSLGNLLLVGGLTNILAAVFGYVITAKRIPWVGLALAFAVVSVLQAGKYEMRQTYWASNSQTMEQVSVLQTPGMMVDWFTAGIVALASTDNGSTAPDVLERASLLHMVLLVQRATPDFIPYLEGETYELLPAMVAPRFLEPDKVASQAGLNLLSIRYGLQYVGSASSTTIGWGLVAEAYANFGFAAVFPVGFLFGAFCGFLMRLSTGAEPLSLPMFMTIAATLTLLNVELDFSYLVVTLAQTMAAVLLLAALPHLFRGRVRQSRAREAIAVEAEGPAARVHGV